MYSKEGSTKFSVFKKIPVKLGILKKMEYIRFIYIFSIYLKIAPSPGVFPVTRFGILQASSPSQLCAKNII
jgi:hypothetical protein